jgi:rod shape-determining protein MreB
MSWTPGSVLSMFSNDLAIDLGTANSLVYSKGRGIVVSEPSIVAVNQKTGKVEASARKRRRCSAGRRGTSRDPSDEGRRHRRLRAHERMLSYFIEKAHNRKFGVRPAIVIGVPSEITQVEKRAVRDSAMRAKATEVYLVEQAMMAAIGAGLPITEPTGNMVVDIGGGTSDVAVISMAGSSTRARFAWPGNEMDEAIIQYIKRKYNLLIGERTAEEVKMKLGSAFPLDEELTMELKGRDLVEGVPKTIVVSDEEIREALAETVATIIEAVRVALEQTPPELSADIVDRGIVLTGGGALLKNLDKRLREETGLPVSIADDPLTSVVMGTGKMLTDFDLLRRVALD